MSEQLIFKQGLGLDVSKDQVSICLMQSEAGRKARILTTHTFSNGAAGFQQLDTHLSRHRVVDVPLHVLMEATGVYYEELAYFLHGKGYRVSVILPNKSKAFAKSLDYKSKTDAIDARVLAQMALERQLRQWAPPGKNMLTLKRLCRERVELLQQKTVVANRLHAKEHAYAPIAESRQRAGQLLAFLEGQIQEVEATIEQQACHDEAIAQKVQLIRSLPGVGLITAVTIIAETNGFELFENKAQVVSYAGYDVVQNDSGTSLKGKTRISKQGNAFIRRALHFPAVTAIRYNALLKNLYERVYERSRIKMKGLVAVQRKLLVLIYTLYRKNQPYDPTYNHQQPQPVPQQNRQEQLSAPA